MIRGGYYLKARIIQESEIAHAPPHVREIWDWLLKEANHEARKYSGFSIKRGELFRTYSEIREGLHWMVGWRKMTYSENHVKKAMKFLRDRGMIATKKEPGGVLITICKYDYYQDPKNYERTKKIPENGTIEEPMENQPIPDNNKNDNNLKNEKKYIKRPKDLEMVIDYFKEQKVLNPQQQAKKWWDHYESKGWKVGKNSIQRWRATLTAWDFERKDQKSTGIPVNTDI